MLYAMANPCRVATVLQINSGMTARKAARLQLMRRSVLMHALIYLASMEQLATMLAIRIAVHALEITVEQIAVIHSQRPCRYVISIL